MASNAVAPEISTDTLQALEEKVLRTIELLKTAREAKAHAEAQVTRLKQQVEEREEEVYAGLEWLMTTAVVVSAVCLYAHSSLGLPREAGEKRAPLVFWTMLMGVWSGLNAVWLAGDLFSNSLYYSLVTIGSPRRAILRGFLFGMAAGIGAIGQIYVGFGTGFLDLDNKGWEDLVIANGHVIRHPQTTGLQQKPVLLRNKGTARFVEITPQGGF